jgi:hypothetical protein
MADVAANTVQSSDFNRFEQMSWRAQCQSYQGPDPPRVQFQVSLLLSGASRQASCQLLASRLSTAHGRALKARFMGLGWQELNPCHPSQTVGATGPAFALANYAEGRSSLHVNKRLVHRDPPRPKLAYSCT